HRTHAERYAGQVSLLGHVPRDLRHLLPDALPGLSGRAAPVLRDGNHGFHPGIGADLERGDHHRGADRRCHPGGVHIQPDLELFQRQAGGWQPLARHDVGVANARHTAEARQLWQRVTCGLSLGLRLQRAGCRRGLHPAKPAAGQESQRPRENRRRGRSWCTKARRHRNAEACRRLVVTTSLLVLAAIMAVVVGWLLRQTLNVKPWVSQRSVATVDGDGALQSPTVKVGLWVFLGVATSLFVVLIRAYDMRMREWAEFNLA